MNSLISVVLAVVFWIPNAASATDTVRVAIRALPASLGNPLTSVGQPASETWGAIFDALTFIDSTGVLQPALATSWEPTSATQWVFHLRRNVRFQNGEMFDANAVIHTVQILQSTLGHTYFVSSEVAGITAIRAVDPYTLEIATAQPDAILPKRLNIVMIVAPRAWDTLGPNGFSQRPIGTGPFQLQDWSEGQTRARLTAYEQSWRAPRLKALELWVISDSVARLQSLLAGNVDIAMGLGPDDLSQLPKDLFDSYVVQTAAVFAIALRNVGNPASPLQDARVRRALNYAVNVQQIADVIFGGTIKPASQGAQPNTWGYNPDLTPYGYDPAHARQLLAEAGYPRGFSLNIDVLTGFAAGDDTLYQKVAEDLAKVGVRVTLRAIPYSRWLQKYTSGAWGDTDGFSARWDSGAYYDSIRAITAASCAKVNPFFCVPSIMSEIDNSGRIFDQGARKQHLQAIMAQLKEIAPAIWLVPSIAYVGMTTKVKDFHAREQSISYDLLSLQ